MSECIEWQGSRQEQGYGRYGTKTHFRQLAHRVAYCEANGLAIDDIKGQVVRHKCDNPPCVNPDHLELGTQIDNIRDMVERGRGTWRKGEAHSNSKLTEAQVREIRELYVRGSRENGQCALASKYGVSQGLISQVLRGSAWAHINEMADD